MFAVFGDRAVDLQAIALVCFPQLDPQHFLLAQAEGHPQQQHRTVAGILIARLTNLRAKVDPVGGPGFRLVGDGPDLERLGIDAGQMTDRALRADDALLASPAAKYLQPRELVLDRLGRQAGGMPIRNERINVLALEPFDVGQIEPELVQPAAAFAHRLA